MMDEALIRKVRGGGGHLPVVQVVTVREVVGHISQRGRASSCRYRSCELRVPSVRSSGLKRRSLLPPSSLLVLV